MITWKIIPVLHVCNTWTFFKKAFLRFCFSYIVCWPNYMSSNLLWLITGLKIIIFTSNIDIMAEEVTILIAQYTLCIPAAFPTTWPVGIWVHNIWFNVSTNSELGSCPEGLQVWLLHVVVMLLGSLLHVALPLLLLYRKDSFRGDKWQRWGGRSKPNTPW